MHVRRNPIGQRGAAPASQGLGSEGEAGGNGVQSSHDGAEEASAEAVACAGRVHHRNGRERDNRLENLEFTSLEENLKARKYNFRDETGKVQRKRRGKRKEKKEEKKDAAPEA